ncbi:DoxX family protein [Flavobacterium sp.]|jgi:uncharacterized membrane protein YphA (DoxX/SURF4 family)|uniref:DoxX family protein n=1 Tax=Flavobacterium sp. TaxID=239 RepID=UPI002A829120|nr:DoxX family protein [Flavobacterium sp.]
MKKVYYWLIRIVPAVIMLQTLFFKFTAAPESIALFTKLGVEPYGRIGSGVIELLAAILLLIPSKSFYGAILGIGTMISAILSHLFIIGINFNNDGGALFTLALVTFVCCVFVLFEERNKFSTFKKPN